MIGATLDLLASDRMGSHVINKTDIGSCIALKELVSSRSVTRSRFEAESPEKPAAIEPNRRGGLTENIKVMLHTPSTVMSRVSAEMVNNSVELLLDT